MAGFRATGRRGNLEASIHPGDTILVSDQPGTLTTVGAGTLTAALLLGGVIYRTGPSGAVADTFDTPGNILTALGAGGPNGPDIVPGIGFKCRYMNASAFTLTLTAPASQGWATGVNNSAGTLAIPTNTWCDILFQFTNTTVPVTVLASTVNANPLASWVLPPGQTVLPMGSAPGSLNIMAGANVLAVGGTPFAGGTRVTNLVQGQGGSVGFIASNNAGATNAGASLTIGPVITLSFLGTGTLP